jgi:cyclopropane fatty-acyl-phospholipid synthase-like methyltransferase
VGREDSKRFAELTYDDFRRMATDESLSPSERIGFPDEYRAGAEGAIFADIVAKLPALSREGARVLDIGSGSSDLAHKAIEHCLEHGTGLVMVDSPEMLAGLPDAPGVTKVEGRFPACPELFEADPFDGVLVYSVLQHVFVDASVEEFVEGALGLLAHNGTALFGDIPNGSKLRRFLSSPAGKEFHRAYSGTDEDPDLEGIEEGRIDDRLLLGLVESARERGFDAYLVPQPESLPMANRREDLLVYKP